jgi:hypothetical protein
MASFSAVSAIENKSFIATPSASELILLNPKVIVLEWSNMFRYLAEAVLEHHLALLPSHVELSGRKNQRIVGVLGIDRVDFASLHEPPHKIFVNWSTTPEGVLTFTQKYGLLDPTGKYAEWKLNLIKRDPKATEAAKFADARSFITSSVHTRNDFSFTVASWAEIQNYFRQYWDWNANGGDWDVVRHDLTTELMTSVVVGAPELCHLGIEVTDLWSLGPKPSVVLTANTLWQYLCTLLVFHKVGDLRKCQNPDCPAPRFIARRKDQVYCCNDCAALLAKRRWWKKHGEEWRRSRTRKKLKGVKH